MSLMDETTLPNRCSAATSSGKPRREVTHPLIDQRVPLGRLPVLAGPRILATPPARRPGLLCSLCAQGMKGVMHASLDCLRCGDRVTPVEGERRRLRPCRPGMSGLRSDGCRSRCSRSGWEQPTGPYFRERLLGEIGCRPERRQPPVLSSGCRHRCGYAASSTTEAVVRPTWRARSWCKVVPYRPRRVSRTWSDMNTAGEIARDGNLRDFTGCVHNRRAQAIAEECYSGHDPGILLLRKKRRWSTCQQGSSPAFGRDGRLKPEVEADRALPGFVVSPGLRAGGGLKPI